MKVAIHQPHYFPWLGYLDKMAKVDKFILMDEVQLTDSSYMYRHQLLTWDGKTKFITIPFEKENYKHKYYNEILLNDAICWQKKHVDFISQNYKKSPFFIDVMDVISPIFANKYSSLCDVTVNSIKIMADLFKIKTELVLQSSLSYPKESKKNQLVLDLCLAANADYYLSGNGARSYMDLTPFNYNNIQVEFQSFSQPIYPQYSSECFIPGLSVLDMLFSIGIADSIDKFNNNIRLNA